MQHTATNGLQWSVCVSISVLVTAVSPAAMTEPIKMPLVGVNSSGPKEPCNVCPDPPQRRGKFRDFPIAEKHWNFLLHCTQQMDQSFLSNCMTAQLLLLAAMLTTGQCYIKFSTMKKSTLLCNLVSLTSDIWKVSVDERLCLCVDSLDTSADDGNVRLNDAVFLQKILHAHQVLAILLRLQVHLPTTHTHAMTDYVKIRHAKGHYGPPPACKI